ICYKGQRPGPSARDTMSRSICSATFPDVRTENPARAPAWGFLDDCGPAPGGGGRVACRSGDPGRGEDGAQSGDGKSYAPGANASAVAREAGIHVGQLLVRMPCG